MLAIPLFVSLTLFINDQDELTSLQHKPWSCYKCGYKSLNSESEMHLKRCQGPGLPLLDITSDGHVMREIKRVNQEKDKVEIMKVRNL